MTRDQFYKSYLYFTDNETEDQGSEDNAASEQNSGLTNT